MDPDPEHSINKQKLLIDFKFFKTAANEPTESNKQNKWEKKTYFLLASRKSLTKRTGSGSGSVNQVYGSKDPDPYQNGIDLEHCFQDIQILKLYSILYIFFDWKRRTWGLIGQLSSLGLRTKFEQWKSEKIPSCFEVKWHIDLTETYCVLHFLIQQSACMIPQNHYPNMSSKKFISCCYTCYLPWIWGHRLGPDRPYPRPLPHFALLRPTPEEGAQYNNSWDGWNQYFVLAFFSKICFCLQQLTTLKKWEIYRKTCSRK